MGVVEVAEDTEVVDKVVAGGESGVEVDTAEVDKVEEVAGACIEA
jgi:hypothetical protein